MSRPLYRKLDEKARQIRLIVIEPSSVSNAAIHCSSETFPLDDNPEYLALSYAWGDAKVTNNIFVNGSILPVTTNLVTALRQLRMSRAEEKSNSLRESPLLLWVDAICINQDDIIERNSQVQLMRDIYGRARQVVVWLGPEIYDSAWAIASIRTIALEVTNLGPENDRLDWLRRYPEFTTHLSLGSPFAAIENLWDRDYWKRVWVFQEIVLARDVLIMCGDETLTWESILTVKQWADSIKITDRRPSLIEPEEWRKLAGYKWFNPKPVDRNNLVRQHWHQPNGKAAVMKDFGLLLLETVSRIGRDRS